jgi:hypothetical protein
LGVVLQRVPEEAKDGCVEVNESFAKVTRDFEVAGRFFSGTLYLFVGF